MSPTPDPEHVNFFFEHLGKFLGATAGALLLAMQYISRSKKAGMARAVLTETPVSHAELLECQMDVKDMVRAELKEFRKDFMEEIKDLYKHINSRDN